MILFQFFHHSIREQEKKRTQERNEYFQSLRRKEEKKKKQLEEQRQQEEERQQQLEQEQQEQEQMIAYQNQVHEQVLSSEEEQEVEVIQEFRPLRLGDMITSQYQLLQRVNTDDLITTFLSRNINKNDQYSFTKIVSLDDIQYMSAMESEILALLSLEQKMGKYTFQQGFPRILYYGQHNHCYFMIHSYYDFDLHSILQTQKLSVQDALSLSFNLIQVLETMHKQKIVHRNLHTKNIVFDLNGELLLKGFEYSKFEQDEDSQLQFQDLLFLPIRAHLQLPLSFIDDLESLCYIMIYCCKSKLPWMDLKDPVQILLSKQTLSSEILCEGIPNFYLSILVHCRTRTTIDYNYIKQTFEEQTDFHILKQMSGESYRGYDNLDEISETITNIDLKHIDINKRQQEN